MAAASQSSTIRRRHVFYVEGYDPQGAPGYFSLFAREFTRFLKLWPLKATLSEMTVDANRHSAEWRIDAAGPNWAVETTYEMLTWDDLIRSDLDRSILRQLPRFARTYADFLVSGTLFRIFHAAWRFALFILYPATMLILAIATSIMGGVIATHWIGRSAAPEISYLAGFVVAITLLAGLIKFLSGWYVVQLASMWAFVREQLKGLRPDFDRRVDAFAERLVATAKAASVDEIVIVGHSCGALVALLVTARALEKDKALGAHGPAIVLLSLGSIMPAAALHPAARHLREAIARLAAEPHVDWIKCQSRKDVINAFQFDPVAALAIPRPEGLHNPLIVPVRFADTLEPATYSRFRNNFFRMHFQFIMANDRRAHYDYFLTLVGPAPLGAKFRSPDGLLSAFAPDATYAPP